MHKYAAYVVGDENIEIGALAALSSFSKYNPEVDLYLYSYIEKMSDVLVNEYKKIGVHLIDITQFINVVDKFTGYSANDLHWPKEVFLNYYIPTLLAKDYQYSVKLDYDLLTVNSSNLDEICPKNQQILSSVKNPFTLLGMIRTNFKYYEKKYGLSFREAGEIAINTGFLVINNNQFVKQDIFNRMINLIEEIREDEPRAADNIYADQGLLTMLIGFESIPFKYIEQRYNVTTTMLNSYTDSEFVNFHYTGKLKPWKNLTVDKKFIKQFTGLNYMIIEYWRDYMKQFHSEVYNTLGINDDFVTLKAMIESNNTQLEKYNVILEKNEAMENKYMSIKFTTKRVIYLILKKVGLK